jgi:ABC-type lipoprotein release transport system permease subunit
MIKRILRGRPRLHFNKVSVSITGVGIAVGSRITLTGSDISSRGPYTSGSL